MNSVILGVFLFTGLICFISSVMFSYDSAIRERNRMNANNGKGIVYQVRKKWYGWVVVEQFDQEGVSTIKS